LAVTTSLSDGTLTVTGDGGADDVAILGTAIPGEIMVVGRNGTVVDGIAPNASGQSIATIQGVTGDLTANFGDGDNVINVDNVYLMGRLDVETGNGKDRVVFGATGVVSSAGSCRVNTGENNDVFRAEDYKVLMGGDFVVTGGDFLGSAALIGASARGSVNVSRKVEVLMRGVTSGSSIEVHSSVSQVTSIAIFTSAASGILQVTTPNGRNSVYIDTCYSASAIDVRAYADFIGSGNTIPVPPTFNIDDTITVARCQTPQLTVNTVGLRPVFTGGDDTVYLYGNYVVGPTTPGTFFVSVVTGDGNDTVAASYNVVLGDMRVTLESLDDTLTLVGNQVMGAVVADGGTGTNRLFLLGNQYPASSFSFFQ
jgi:hypothetical protein